MKPNTSIEITNLTPDEFSEHAKHFTDFYFFIWPFHKRDNNLKNVEIRLASKEDPKSQKLMEDIFKFISDPDDSVWLDKCFEGAKSGLYTLDDVYYAALRLFQKKKMPTKDMEAIAAYWGMLKNTSDFKKVWVSSCDEEQAREFGEPFAMACRSLNKHDCFIIGSYYPVEKEDEDEDERSILDISEESVDMGFMRLSSESSTVGWSVISPAIFSEICKNEVQINDGLREAAMTGPKLDGEDFYRLQSFSGRRPLQYGHPEYECPDKLDGRSTNGQYSESWGHDRTHVGHTIQINRYIIIFMCELAEYYRTYFKDRYEGAAEIYDTLLDFAYFITIYEDIRKTFLGVVEARINYFSKNFALGTFASVLVEFCERLCSQQYPKHMEKFPDFYLDPLGKLAACFLKQAKNTQEYPYNMLHALGVFEKKSDFPSDPSKRDTTVPSL